MGVLCDCLTGARCGRYELQRRLDTYAYNPTSSRPPTSCTTRKSGLLPELDELVRAGSLHLQPQTQQTHPQSAHSDSSTRSSIITCNAVTPGVVNTELGRFAPWWYKALAFPFKQTMMRQPSEAANTQVQTNSIQTQNPPTILLEKCELLHSGDGGDRSAVRRGGRQILRRMQRGPVK